MHLSKQHLPGSQEAYYQITGKKGTKLMQKPRENKNKHWENFKKYRKVATKEVTKSCNSYIKNIIGESLKTNPSDTFIRQKMSDAALWRHQTKQNRKSWHSSTKIATLKTTDHNKATALNDHFKSVFTNEQLPNPTKSQSPFPSIQTLEIGLKKS